MRQMFVAEVIHPNYQFDNGTVEEQLNQYAESLGDALWEPAVKREFDAAVEQYMRTYAQGGYNLHVLWEKMTDIKHKVDFAASMGVTFPVHTSWEEVDSHND